MKTGIHSIQEFAAEIARRAETKKDFIANTKNGKWSRTRGADWICTLAT